MPAPEVLSVSRPPAKRKVADTADSSERVISTSLKAAASAAAGTNDSKGKKKQKAPKKPKLYCPAYRSGAHGILMGLLEGSPRSLINLYLIKFSLLLLHRHRSQQLHLHVQSRSNGKGKATL